jgi:transposase
MAGIDSLARYWASLRDAVHPHDAEIFRRANDHGFNLDFPPPAFVGDIARALVIILDNNGGFDPIQTPGEFPDESTRAQYREALSSPRPLDRASRSVSPYHLSRNYSPWLESGQAALVNAVAYRSVDTKGTDVKRLAKLLPSARFHRIWLRDVLIPLAARGERFVVVHRWGLWGNEIAGLRNVQSAIFSRAPIGPNLTQAEMQAAAAYLSRSVFPA